jgi:hypothetical protein
MSAKLTLEQQLAEAVAAEIADAIRPLQQRIAALEGQVQTLEQMKQLKYCGVFESGVWYRAGSAVTKSGGVWIALRDTNASPGDEGIQSRAWQLAVKAGKDGKPGRDGKDAR